MVLDSIVLYYIYEPLTPPNGIIYLKCKTAPETCFCIIYTELPCRMAVSRPARLCHVALSHSYWFYRLADIFAVCRIYVSCYLNLIKCLKLLSQSRIAIHYFQRPSIVGLSVKDMLASSTISGPGELSWATITQNRKYRLVLILFIAIWYGKSTHSVKLDVGALCPIPSPY